MWPKLLVVEEKNISDLYFLINSSEELERISEKIIRHRLNYDLYCCESDINDAYIAFENQTCWKFLKTRSGYGYEYEKVELTEFNNESWFTNNQ